MIAEPERQKLSDELATFAAPPWLQRRVLELSHLMGNGGCSPVDAVRILAGTAVAAAEGMASAIDDGNIQLADIVDIENLAHVVVMLRGSAAIFEALLRRSQQ